MVQVQYIISFLSLADEIFLGTIDRFKDIYKVYCIIGLVLFL